MASSSGALDAGPASGKSPASTTARKKPFYRSLLFQILLGLIAGLVVGIVWPEFGSALKPLGDGFINLVKMIIAPLVFCVVVIGIAGAGDLASLKRIGLKTLIYFEVVTTLALIIGVAMTVWLKPGEGLNIDLSTLDASSVEKKAGGHELTASGFLLGIIPLSVMGAFVENNLLQILLFSVLFGVAMIVLGKRSALIFTFIEGFQDIIFKIIGWIMKLAPIATFGVVAFTVGNYGLESLVSFGKLIGVFFLVLLAILVIFAAVVRIFIRVSFFKVLNYFREEILTAALVGSSEAVLPQIVAKLEKAGCPRTVVGVVVPSGYSFNLDGASAYLSVAIIFLAQVSGADLSMTSIMTIVLVSLLTSKGMAGVAGSAFVALLATLSAVGGIPAAAAVLILGPDQIMGKGRTMLNLIGNIVATLFIARWERELDSEQLRRELHRKRSSKAEIVTPQKEEEATDHQIQIAGR